MKNIKVIIDISDVYPTDEELDQRDAMANWLNDQDIGELIDEGSGQGTIQVVFVVDKAEKAKNIIVSAIEKYFPRNNFKINIFDHVIDEEDECEGEPLFEVGTCLSVKLYNGGYVMV